MNLIKSAIADFAYVLNLLILIRCLLSWFPTSKGNPLVQFLYSVTDPILSPIRSLIQKSPLGGAGMMIDFSPVFAMLLVSAVSKFIISIL